MTVGSHLQLKHLCFAVTLSITALAAVNARLNAQTYREIDQVSVIRSLTADEAGKGHPVRVRGVVTVVSGWKNSFFFQDATAGISVDRENGLPALHQGQEVEIQGNTATGLFAPVIVAHEVRLLGDGQLPRASLVDLDGLAGGKLDSQWIAIKGVVRAATVKPSWGRSVLFLDIDVGGGTLVTARVRNFSDTGWQKLPTSTVSIRGVCATTFNDRRQFIGLRLFVDSLDDVKVRQSGPADLFDRPLHPLSGLLRFDPKQDDITPVKVRGTVTHIQPGQGIYIQDGPEGVFIRDAETTPVAIGAEVEAVGYPGGGGYSPSLESSKYRVLGTKPQPVAPITVVASQMIVDKDGFSISPFDSRLVRLKGTLEQTIPGVEEHVLFLRDGTSVFTARLLKSAGDAGIPPAGSLVEVTGICVTRVDSDHEALSFRVLLRSASDIVVLHRAPWWNASHAKLVVAVLLAAVVLLAGWLAIVRREARLRNMALTDALTGLYNRRGFGLLAEHQWQLAVRKRAALLLFYIDANDFKAINDSLGHKQGDVALQMVAAALQECFRTTDVLGRLGGDEFAVFVVDPLPRSGERLERRLTSIVEHANQKQGRRFQLSLSVGFLEYEDSSNFGDFEELLARADIVMYEKKMAGKARMQASEADAVMAGS